MRKMIGDMKSGVMIERTENGGIRFKEYDNGERTGRVTINHDEVQQLIKILEDFIKAWRKIM